MKKETIRITIYKKDKILLGNLAIKYKTNPKDLFNATLKILKYYQPELKEFLK